MNRLEDSAEIGCHITVLESQHSVALRLKPGGALGIAPDRFRLTVDTAVDLQDKTRGKAGKVGNVGPDWNLPAKV